MDTGWRYVGKQFLLIAIVLILCLVFLALGLVIGYGLIGDGSNPLAILTPSKWADIIGKFTGK